jgi:hypothetical protein
MKLKERDVEILEDIAKKFEEIAGCLVKFINPPIIIKQHPKLTEAQQLEHCKKIERVLNLKEFSAYMDKVFNGTVTREDQQMFEINPMSIVDDKINKTGTG